MNQKETLVLTEEEEDKLDRMFDIIYHDAYYDIDLSIYRPTDARVRGIMESRGLG